MRHHYASLGQLSWISSASISSPRVVVHRHAQKKHWKSTGATEAAVNKVRECSSLEDL